MKLLLMTLIINLYNRIFFLFFFISFFGSDTASSYRKLFCYTQEESPPLKNVKKEKNAKRLMSKFLTLCCVSNIFWQIDFSPSSLSDWIFALSISSERDFCWPLSYCCCVCCILVVSEWKLDLFVLLSNSNGKWKMMILLMSLIRLNRWS